MFGTRCVNCGRKSKNGFTYCPHCGNRKKSNEDLEREFGLIGMDNSLKLPFGFNFLFNSLVKEMDKQFQRMDKEMTSNKIPLKEGINITISTNSGGPMVNVNNQDSGHAKKIKITEDMEKKLSTLPKKEAETSVRRFSNKVVYEIAVPGVKKVNDIIVSRLENSFEIKAIGDNAIFFKLIPLNSPLLGYALKDDKLIMEFKG